MLTNYEALLRDFLRGSFLRRDSSGLLEDDESRRGDPTSKLFLQNLLYLEHLLPFGKCLNCELTLPYCALSHPTAPFSLQKGTVTNPEFSTIPVSSKIPEERSSSAISLFSE